MIRKKMNMLTQKNNSSNIDSTNLRKNFIWNTIGSTVASFSSLVYMMIVTRLNGINDAGIFSFAFSLASTFLIIGTYSGRTFQVTDKNKKTTDSDYFYMKAVTCMIMIFVGLVFCLIHGYSGDKFIVVMFLTFFRVLEAVGESIFAVIQKKNRLYQVGRSMFIKASASLLGFFIADFLTQDIALSCIMVIAGHLLPIIFYDLPRLKKTGFKLERFRGDRVLYLLKIGFYTFGFSFLNLYIVNAARYVLDVAASDSVQTIYGIIAMPATVLSLIGQYLVQPFLTSFKQLFSTDAKGFQNLVIKLCLIMVGIGIICLPVTWVLGIPVLELLYAVDLNGNLAGLMIIMVGGIFGSLILVFSTAFITMRRTDDQFWIVCTVSLVMLGLSQMLVRSQGLWGAYLSYMIAMLLMSAAYAGVFAYRMRGLKQNFAEEVKRAAQE